MGWLVLRRAAEKRPPLHPDQRKWVKFGVHRQAFSSESQVGFGIRQRFAKMAASVAVNGKSRLKQRISDLEHLVERIVSRNTELKRWQD